MRKKWEEIMWERVRKGKQGSEIRKSGLSTELPGSVIISHFVSEGQNAPGEWSNSLKTKELQILTLEVKL